MPLTLVAPATHTVRKQGELTRIVIDITCDGTNNTIAAINRYHIAVQRDESNNALQSDPTLIIHTYVMSDFTAGVQTGIQNFTNALDVKP